MMMIAAMAVGLAACGNTGGQESQGASSAEAEDSGDAAKEDSGDGAKYKIGICQLVQHEALDAATEGFKDAPD